MRLRHRDGTVVHLAYCTNVHPAEDLAGVVGQLARFAGPVRDRLGADRLGVGLWLARDVATALTRDPDAVVGLRRELERLGLEVVTFNGFPYRGFHAASVKKAVYRPDWSEPDRLDYTLDLAGLLAALMPDDAVRGSVSTVPLGWREPWDDGRQLAALHSLQRLADGLTAVQGRTGRTVRVGLEPEPGCVVETTPQAADRLGSLAGGPIGVCLDACHLAVGFEDPAAAVARLAGAGLQIVKTQASAALHVDDPSDPAQRAALGAFAEQRFLHQVREGRPGSDGAGVVGRDDLDDALSGDPHTGDPLSGADPWRVHFHVPLHTEPAPPLRSTREELDRTLGVLFAGDRALTDHVEIETYTWGVLPDADRPTDDAGLVSGIAAELAWVRDRLIDHGLEPCP